MDAACNCNAPYLPAGQRAAEAVAANPERSDRAIAAAIGVNQSTVSRVRKKTTDADASVEKRTGLDGRSRKQPSKSRVDDIVDRAVARSEATKRRQAAKAAVSGESIEESTANKFNRTNDSVSWAAWTWNPVTGCLHGCKYCYARAIAQRIYAEGFKPTFQPEKLDAPANTTVPKEAAQDPRLKRVFICSMADLYGKWVPDEWIEQVHAKCINNPQWDYLLLTKFPRRYVGLQLPPTAWVGTSVDEQKRVRLAEEAFRQIKDVRVKWLSLEPLLAPLEFTDLSMFDWVVIGAQSATVQPDGVGHVPEFAPPFEWVARLTAQAHEAGCRVYHKPNLLGIPNPHSPGMKLLQEAPILRAPNAPDDGLGIPTFLDRRAEPAP